MKSMISVLALAVAGALVGCNADGSLKTAWNDDNTNGNMAQAGVNDTRNGTYNTNDRSNVVPNQPSNVQLGYGNDKTTASVALTNEDRQFVKTAAASGLYEVQASQKALAKSNDQQVKTLAQHMVDDHTKANSELMALAQRKGIDIGALTADQVSMLAKLDSLNGSDFNREYLDQQRAAHQQAVSLFQAAASGSSDRDIRDWAAGKVATLRDHLAMINNDRGNNTNVGNEK